VNTSRDTPTSIPADQTLPLVVFYASQICYDHAEYGVYLSQALTTGGRSQTGAYAYKSGWEFLSMNRHPQWRRHFYDIGVNVNGMINAAEKINSKNFILIGRTILLQSTLLTTDVFGDMPLSQVYKSNSPSYDTQESIYNWMLKEADDLIALYNDSAWINNPTNKTITVKMDRIFGGNLGKWRAYTKALKARILLRNLPNWNNTPESCDKIIAAVDDALNDPAYADAITSMMAVQLKKLSLGTGSTKFKFRMGTGTCKSADRCGAIQIFYLRIVRKLPLLLLNQEDMLLDPRAEQFK